jgi:hypothetical protein
MKLHQKWHGFLMIKLAVLAAIDKAEQRTAELRHSIFMIRYSTFDIRFLINSARPKLLFRFDRPFFWPAAGLTPETCFSNSAGKQFTASGN